MRRHLFLHYTRSSMLWHNWILVRQRRSNYHAYMTSRLCPWKIHQSNHTLPIWSVDTVSHRKMPSRWYPATHRAFSSSSSCCVREASVAEWTLYRPTECLHEKKNHSQTNNVLKSYYHSGLCRRIQVSHQHLLSFLSHLQNTTTNNRADMAHIRSEICTCHPKKNHNTQNNARIKGCIPDCNFWVR